MQQTVGILGTPINVMDTDEVLDRLEQFIQDGRFHQVATANTDFLINAVADPELRHILRHADLVVPDGMPVVWASKVLGCPLPERVTGADIVPRLAALAACKGYKIYMLGARPDVIVEAKARLEADHPGLQIVGCISPPNASIIEMDSEALLEDIAHASPDILLVAFGNPKQEKWIHMHRARLKHVPVCIGVGGTFDFIAGRSIRAPQWLQRCGLEWTHRLIQDPRRLWRRYGRDLAHGSVYLLRQWWMLRRQRTTGHSEIRVAQSGKWTFLSLTGDFTTAILPRFRASIDEALHAGQNVILDFGGVAAVDTEALGTLIEVLKRGDRCQQEVRTVAIPPGLTKTLHGSHMNDVLTPNSLALALTDCSHNGLSWQVQCNLAQATVTVHGASTQSTVHHLENLCTQLLEEGLSIELDTRGVNFVDSYLLATLYRLRRTANGSESALSKPAAFHLVVGNTLHQALQRENILELFSVRTSPTLQMSQDETDNPSHSEIVTYDVKRTQSRADRTYLILKRFLDIAVATFALIVFLPLFIVIAAAIVIETPGPILFSQTRVGKDNRLFRFYKFRSMIVNAAALQSQLAPSNEASGPIFKMRADPRVTRVGRILRKYSIDELPQLFNVFRGDMSLVGPRPHLPAEVEQYNAYQKKRLTVQPGLVCLREVSGRSDLSFEHWIELDLVYITSRSLRTDLRILLRLLPAVFSGRGAY